MINWKLRLGVNVSMILLLGLTIVAAIIYRVSMGALAKIDTIGTMSSYYYPKK